MAGETGGEGGGRDLPLRARLIPIPGWDPGDPIYNKMGPFYFFQTVFQQLQYLYRLFWALGDSFS